jgi:hypothetical protein
MCAAAAASSSSSAKPAQEPQYGAAPPPQAMDTGRALGLWKSSFGAVKIEEDLSKGAAGAGYVHGVWVYQRQGQDVVGYFGGNLRGNVLEFAWQEPAQPAPLVGQGYIVFDPQGQRFAGKWWTTARDRTGEWSGWRQEGQQPPPANDPYNNGGTNPYGGAPYGGNDPYGGSTYGYGYPPPPPAPAPPPPTPYR